MADSLINALDADQDDDGLPDGLEVGIVPPVEVSGLQAVKNGADIDLSWIDQTSTDPCVLFTSSRRSHRSSVRVLAATKGR